MSVSVIGLSAKEALEQRAKIITNCQSNYKERGDDWSAEDESGFDAAMKDAETLAAHAKRQSRLEAAGSFSLKTGEGNEGQNRPDPNEGTQESQGGLQPQPTMIRVRKGNDSSGRAAYVDVPVDRTGSQDYSEAFSHFIDTGHGRAPLLEPNSGGGINSAQVLSSDDAPRAGFLLASEQFAAGILKEVDDLLFIRQHAKVHTVREAGSLGIKCRKARANTFAWGPELKTADADTSLKYGKRTLTPHYLTGSAELSRDLLRRTLGGAESEVRGELARDAGEKMEDGYLLGSGAGDEPLGVFTNSADGIGATRDVNTGSATGITYNGLIDAKFSLKSQYRRGRMGQVRWLMHRTAIRDIVKLVDAEGQPLFRVGAGVRQDSMSPDDELLTFPVDESERAPSTFTNGNYFGLLANWNFYEIADALDMEVQVLDQTKAHLNIVEYIARLKTDGMPTLEEAFVRMKCAA